MSNWKKLKREHKHHVQYVAEKKESRIKIDTALNYFVDRVRHNPINIYHQLLDLLKITTDLSKIVQTINNAKLEFYPRDLADAIDHNLPNAALVMILSGFNVDHESVIPALKNKLDDKEMHAVAAEVLSRKKSCNPQDVFIFLKYPKLLEIFLKIYGSNPNVTITEGKFIVFPLVSTVWDRLYSSFVVLIKAGADCNKLLLPSSDRDTRSFLIDNYVHILDIAIQTNFLLELCMLDNMDYTAGYNFHSDHKCLDLYRSPLDHLIHKSKTMDYVKMFATRFVKYFIVRNGQRIMVPQIPDSNFADPQYKTILMTHYKKCIKELRRSTKLLHRVVTIVYDYCQ